MSHRIPAASPLVVLLALAALAALAPSASAAPPDARREALLARLDRLRADLASGSVDDDALASYERGLETIERAASEGRGPDGACVGTAVTTLTKAGWTPGSAVERATDRCRGALSGPIFERALAALLAAGWTPSSALDRAREVAAGPRSPARAEAFGVALEALSKAGWTVASALDRARELTLELRGPSAACFRSVAEALATYTPVSRLEAARDRCR